MAASLLPSDPLASPRRRARIEIIPLIDVIFFLLATFVLFTLSLNHLLSLPVDLPQAQATVRPNKDDDIVVLQISDAGTAYWNKELISTADLVSRLRQLKAANAVAKVLVTGDEKARFGDAVHAFDAVRAAGITQVSIETAFRRSGG